MLGYSVAQYLSRFQISSPLWGQKLIPLLDYTFSNNYVDNSELSSAFYQIVNKYTNTTELPLESLQHYVQEMGYGYILEFFQPDEEAAQRLVSFLVVIHFLKGSRKGLELILDIMGISGTIVEWYESIPLGVVNTFTLLIDSDTLTGNDNPETYKNFEKFVRSYVYPEVNFVIIYRAKINYIIYSDMQGTMKIKYPCFIDATKIALLVQNNINLDLTSGLDWTFIDCYKDVYDRIIPNSTEEWYNINSVTWRNDSIFYGAYGIWNEPCVLGASAESVVVDTGEFLNYVINLTYSKQVIDPYSSISIKWRTSADNITWSEYIEFSETVNDFRYYQFKVTFNCPYNRLIILE